MMWTLQDRRTRRSTQSYTAVRYQLEHTREQAGLHALVLADDDGLVVASSGDRAICDELAAISPLYCRSVMGVPMPPLLQGAEVAIRPLRLNGQDLYLASVGGSVARDAMLSQSINGVKRILATN